MSDQVLTRGRTHPADRSLFLASRKSKAPWWWVIWVGLCLLGSRQGWCADANEWQPGHGNAVWGEIGLSGIFSGSRMAPNGVAYDPLFAIDTDFNVGLNKDRTLYLFSRDWFWAQEATPGVTNSRQGSLDFSKREYDLSIGAAWRYWPRTEIRAFGYSLNNLNRGNSATSSSGYKDGVGFENRFHFNSNDDFLGLGYYVTKELVDQEGSSFKPGLFLNAKLHAPLIPGLATIYAEPQLIFRDAFIPKLLNMDAYIGFTPFENKDILLSLGMDVGYDLGKEITRSILYLRVSTRF